MSAFSLLCLGVLIFKDEAVIRELLEDSVANPHKHSEKRLAHAEDSQGRSHGNRDQFLIVDAHHTGKGGMPGSSPLDLVGS